MKYASVCSGVEAASLAWMPLGWEAVWFSEIEPFPCAVLKERFPTVPNLGDMTKIQVETKENGDQVFTNGDGAAVTVPGGVDLLVGGTPCFAAGTMILTPDGYKPIENIRVGDSVINADGEEDIVTAVGSKQAKIGELKVYGRNVIRCTENHPFMTIAMKRDHRRSSPTYANIIPDGEYEFTSAKDSVGRYCARLPQRVCLESKLPDNNTGICEDVLMKLAGWYVGDGYIRRYNGKNKKQVILALVAPHKIEKFLHDVSETMKTSVCKDGKVYVSNTKLADWLVKNFGEHAESKRIPYWVYSSRFKENFIAGYESADGTVRKNGVSRVSSVSKALAYGYADLKESASVMYWEPEETKEIQGRLVRQKPYWNVQVGGENSRVRLIDGRFTSIVRSYKNDGTTGTGTVYNITVERKHTYIAEGLAVHNCQGFSVAGKRGGGNDLRSALCFTYIQLLETMRPRWFVWENVPGVFSTNGGNDFLEFIRRIDEVGYSVAWRVLDAQYVRVDGYPRAVPQRRRRVFVIGHIGADWQYPASVLFEPSGLFRDTPPRRVKGKGFTGNIENCPGMADRTWDPSGVNPTLNQCNAGSGIIGASNQELFSQNMNGLVMESQYGNIAGTLEARHDSSPCADRGQNIVYAAHETGQGFWQPGETSGTIRAEGENRPSRPSNVVYSAGFNGEAGEKARGIAFEKEVCPTQGAEKPVPDVLCVHGSQDPVCNSEHANAVNRNNGLKNCVCISKQKKPEGRFWNGEDVAGTLAVTSDRQLMPDKGRLQCVIEPREDSVECLDTRQVDVHDTDLAPTLIATDYKGGKAICYENHAQDSRIKDAGEVSPQLNAKAGTGYKVQLFYDTCKSKAEKCQDFSPSKIQKLDMEPDTDAPENTFCFTCKWYGGEGKNGVCMLNPPKIFPHYNPQGKYKETRYERPEVSWDDYCSRWEKEEERTSLRTTPYLSVHIRTPRLADRLHPLALCVHPLSLAAA